VNDNSYDQRSRRSQTGRPAPPYTTTSTTSVSWQEGPRANRKAVGELIIILSAAATKRARPNERYHEIASFSTNERHLITATVASLHADKTALAADTNTVQQLPVSLTYTKTYPCSNYSTWHFAAVTLTTMT